MLLDQCLPPGGPPEGWSTWVENSLRRPTKVRVVGTESYLRRCQKREAPKRVKGATWEGAILKQALFDAKNISDKFAAVIFEPEDEAFIPPVLRERNWFVPTDEAGYEQLYLLLTSVTSASMRGQ